MPAGAIPEQTALSLKVNGESKRSVVPVHLVGKAVEMRAEDLRSVRIRVDPALPDGDWVRLDGLAGVSASIDMPSQELDLRAESAAMVPYRIDSGTATTDLPTILPLTAFMLDYSVYGATGSGDTRSFLNGFVGGRLSTARGTLVSSYNVFLGGRPGEPHVVPLETYWRMVDPVAVRSYTVGDMVSGALRWTNAYRLAGLQVQSAFEQRSDIITTALPGVSGSVAVPSTLDIYVNNIRAYSGSVPAGPFAMDNLPSTSGGDVRLVTRDATGRQFVVSTRYYYSPFILKQGLVQYSGEVGILRRDYGVKAFDYEPTLAGTFSARYGIDDHLTVEGHGEAMAGLVQAGLGIDREIGGIGAISLAGAGSQSGGRRGLRVSADWNMQVGSLTVYVGTTRSSRGYMDIARLTQLRNLDRRWRRIGSVMFDLTAYARQVDRAGAAYQLPFAHSASVGLSYSAIRTGGRTPVRSVNLNAAATISGRVNVHLEAFRQVDRTRSSAILLGVSLFMGRGVNVSANASRQYGRTGMDLQASGTTSPRQGQVAWSVYDREVKGAAGFRQALVSTRSGFANLQAGVEQSGRDVRGTAQVSGTILLVDGSIHAVDHVGDAFALVRNAGPGVEVRQDNAVVANARTTGTALLPDILPNRDTMISVDPVGLPIGWSVPRTESRIVAGYQNGVIVDFGARRTRSAIVGFIDGTDTPIEPGYAVHRQHGPDATVGYAGEAYLEDMQPIEHVTIDRGPLGICHATIEYPSGGSPQVNIRNVRCQTIRMASLAQ